MEKGVTVLASRISAILRKAGVVRAGVFGSFARGKVGRGSDVDLLVKYRRGGKSLFDLIALEAELEAALGRKVDLVTYDSLNPLLRNRILGEEVRII